MRKPGGYAFIVNPAASEMRLDSKAARPEALQEGTTEFDTYRCGHCGGMRHVRARERPEDTGGLCKQCFSLICPNCLDTARCEPLERKLEQAEKRTQALRSYGI